jgi:DNA repair protein RecN (Recombination protein N)
MLTDLTIKNVAIIDTLHISLKPGLTVLTGETGAGKSIIIDAVGLIMGNRASSDLIRSGEEEAVVEALFDISALPEIKQLLSEAGFDPADELLVKRSLSRSGKNRIFINGGMATLALLTDIAPRLINIYGQHDSQTLLKPENHLRLLDAYAGLNENREAFARLFQRLNTLCETIAGLDSAEHEAAHRADLLAYQSQEISQAALKDGEEEPLEEQRLLLAHAEKLATGSGDAFERLYGGDGAILGQLRRISAAISELAAIDPALQGNAA